MKFQPAIGGAEIVGGSTCGLKCVRDDRNSTYRNTASKNIIRVAFIVSPLFSFDMAVLKTSPSNRYFLSG